MDKRIVGLVLIVISLLLTKFVHMDGLNTASIAMIMAFSAIAWLGVIYLIPNPAGEHFSMLKMIFKGALGMGAMVLILVLGLTETKNHIEQELAAYGIETEAVVIGKDLSKLPAKRGEVNYIYYLTLKFTDQKGSAIQIKTEVQEYAYKRNDPGSKLRLRYSSRNKDIHRILE